MDLTVSTRKVTHSFKQVGGVIWFMLLKDHAGYTREWITRSREINSWAVVVQVRVAVEMVERAWI